MLQSFADAGLVGYHPAPPQTRVTVTEEQYAFARLLVTGIDRITADDLAAVAEGAAKASEILPSPARVRAILSKAYEVQSQP